MAPEKIYFVQHEHRHTINLIVRFFHEGNLLHVLPIDKQSIKGGLMAPLGW
jgi:hypothetical protein